MPALTFRNSRKFGGHPAEGIHELSSLKLFFLVLSLFLSLKSLPTLAENLEDSSSSFWKERFSAAEYKENPQELNRLKNPTSIYLSLGTPAPSYLAVNLGTQLDEQFQILLSYGQFWSGDLRIHSIEGLIRLHLFQTDFTPMLGAGVNTLLFRGEGNIQTLSESSLLLNLHLGLDWAMSTQFRLSAGYSFHLPLRLNFPFINVGYSF